MNGQGMRERVGPMVLRACFFCTAILWVACSSSGPVVLDVPADKKSGEVGIQDRVAAGDMKLDVRMQDIREAEAVVDTCARELDVATMLDADADIPATTDVDIIELADQVDSHDGAEVADGETIDICVPDCTDAICGDDDGCEGLCQGLCLGEQDQCFDGVCLCLPDCEEKKCGDDGCGGFCGYCAEPQDICTDGVCVCQPECSSMECGSDGCGGSCGDCLDDEPCTLDSCVDGTCQNEYLPGCCDADEDCFNELDCLVEVCVIVEGADAGVCDSYLAEGHCTSPEDCETKACHVIACEECLCIWTPVDGCCVDDDECAEPAPCEVSTCVENACVTEPLNCDDGDPASVDSCDQQTGECVHCWPDCEGKECGDDGCEGSCGDCIDDKPCTVDSCEDALCTNDYILGCCEQDEDCLMPLDCLVEVCVIPEGEEVGECEAHLAEGHCSVPEDCETKECHDISCEECLCIWTPIDDCCVDDDECAEPAPCEVSTCVENACVTEPLNCDDGDPASVDSCDQQTGECVHCWPDCEGKECGDDGCGGLCGWCADGFPCTEDKCDADQQCTHEVRQLPGCCSTDEDCDDDNECSADHCDLARTPRSEVGKCGSSAGLGIVLTM